MFRFILAAIVLIMSEHTLAFGQNGHRIVAKIAENHLHPAAKKAIHAITVGRQLAELSTWPDEIRSNPAWDRAKPWHYISVDDNESWEGLKRSKDGDILEALERFEKVLRDKSAGKEKQWQALAFYTHFVGDLHQPLHVGRRDDRGGNDIEVTWFSEKSNLHAVWDSGLIDARELSFSEHAVFIDKSDKKQIAAWQNSTYLDWAKESKAVRAQVYAFGQQRSRETPSLSYEYLYLNSPLITERLQQAGIRLAGKLNAIFTPGY